MLWEKESVGLRERSIQGDIQRGREKDFSVFPNTCKYFLSCAPPFQCRTTINHPNLKTQKQENRSVTVALAICGRHIKVCMLYKLSLSKRYNDTHKVNRN